MIALSSFPAPSRRVPPVEHPPLLDPLLLPFVLASNEKQAETYLNRLIHQYADPVITAATRRYINTASATNSCDGADLRSEAIRILITRVCAIRDCGACPITDFLAYVKVTARHLCWQHGRKARRERPFSSFGTGADQNGEEGISFEEMAQVLSGASYPMGTCHLIVQRGLLRAVWEEVCALPRQQRLALLYNFRDKNGGNALPFLTLCHVVTPTELAHALEVPQEDLETYLETLPMEDSMLAELLEVSPREVINMRVSARRRLMRRTRLWLDPSE